MLFQWLQSLAGSSPACGVYILKLKVIFTADTNICLEQKNRVGVYCIECGKVIATFPANTPVIEFAQSLAEHGTECDACSNALPETLDSVLRQGDEVQDEYFHILRDIACACMYYMSEWEGVSLDGFDTPHCANCVSFCSKGECEMGVNIVAIAKLMKEQLGWDTINPAMQGEEPATPVQRWFK